MTRIIINSALNAVSRASSVLNAGGFTFVLLSHSVDFLSVITVKHAFCPMHYQPTEFRSVTLAYLRTPPFTYCLGGRPPQSKLSPRNKNNAPVPFKAQDFMAKRLEPTYTNQRVGYCQRIGSVRTYANPPSFRLPTYPHHPIDSAEFNRSPMYKPTVNVHEGLSV